MIRSIHPFPARMAPELALATLKDVTAGSVVLDPMAGSGTVLRQAAELGLRPIGFDMDPLAVLMARVWTTPVEMKSIEALAGTLNRRLAEIGDDAVSLPWMDQDQETTAFVAYWFGEPQLKRLRAYAYVLSEMTLAADPNEAAAIDVLKLNLSRIIVTKEMCASLARDTSHSRPHKVADESDYDVRVGYERSLLTLTKRLAASAPKAGAKVMLGDVRKLDGIEDATVDAVLTSPPYLNAIDYLRGHRLSLVWLGHQVSTLRSIRSDSIGAERSPREKHKEDAHREIKTALGSTDELPQRHRNMIDRYADDLDAMLSELARVTKPGGTATFVVGNSCLKGVFIRNADGVSAAARVAGFEKRSTTERDLPNASRYLPLSAGSLSKRMRTETILKFERANA